MTKNKQKGFTLIELLVVIAIIGVLSSVVLASLNTARQKSRDARRIADLGQLRLAFELYFDTNRNYPPSPLTAASLVTPGYISAIPVDPLSTDAAPIPYLYATLGAGTVCNSYHLGAILEGTNSALNSDADAPATEVPCTGGGSNFAGTDPTYDQKP